MSQQVYTYVGSDNGLFEKNLSFIYALVNIDNTLLHNNQLFQLLCTLK
jgi:hypothetical protein